MSARNSVPIIIQRMLWSESIGHCMNPQCLEFLFCDNATIGDMAHIVPVSDDGNDSFENLVLICPNCHRQIDSTRGETTICRLKGWKRERNSEIRSMFTKRHKSFVALNEAVVPLLKRNGRIFESYGPDNDDRSNPGRHSLWEKFEGELIANNEKLGLLLSHNEHLLHQENNGIVQDFMTHAREFVETRDDTPIQRIELFPKDLLSIFGLEKAANLSVTSNLSALQNFVTHLISEGRFVQLSLVPEQTLVYIEDGKQIRLDLLDSPNLRQIYFSNRFYHPNNTEVRLQNVVFMLEWLHRNGILCEFKDVRDLTELTLNGTHKVRLLCKYCLSISDLYELTIDDGLIVVNVHHWNGAPISQDAYDYGSQVGIQLFRQRDFLAFAYRNLK